MQGSSPCLSLLLRVRWLSSKNEKAGIPESPSQQKLRDKFIVEANAAAGCLVFTQENMRFFTIPSEHMSIGLLTCVAPSLYGCIKHSYLTAATVG